MQYLNEDVENSRSYEKFKISLATTQKECYDRFIKVLVLKNLERGFYVGFFFLFYFGLCLEQKVMYPLASITLIFGVPVVRRVSCFNVTRK